VTEHQEFVRDVIAGIIATGVIIYGPRIAVIRDPEEEVSKGGIILPEQARRKEPRGTVVAIGLGVDRDEDDPVAGMAVGDRVMYTKYNPILFNITLPNGQEAGLELMHVSDLYIGWRE
jgi:co-chaperonin GroES (HSP10)